MRANRWVVALAGLAVLVPALWTVVRAADTAGGSVSQRPRVSGKLPLIAREQRSTLRGLQSVYVAVEGLRPEVERLGLTREGLQTDTELQLRQYNIRVRSETPGELSISALLYVRVSVVGADNDAPFPLAVSMEVTCLQGVYLDRDPTMWCVARTWETSSVARVSRAQLGQIRDMVKDHVATFINDYLAANPKEGKIEEETAEGGGGGQP